nr:MAG TPA: hypothetical protein [Bacteriophage sp.]
MCKFFLLKINYLNKLFRKIYVFICFVFRKIYIFAT